MKTSKIVTEEFAPEIFTQDYALNKPQKDYSSILMPSIFSDGMIFQRGKNIRIFGYAPNGKEVTVIWKENEFKTVSDAKSGAFLVELPPEEAGKNYYLTIKCDGKELFLKDIYIGDVFLCGGQSNMELHMDDKEWYGDFYTSQFDSLTVTEEIKEFYIPVSSASQIKYSLPNGSRWITAEKENLGIFAPLPYLFAVNIWKKTGVPTAVVNCSAGGTAVQQWLSSDAQKGIDGAEKSNFYPLQAQQFNSMLYPLFPYNFDSCFYYQGCANGSYDVLDGLYPEFLSRMINEWRMLDCNEKLPFYIIELAGFMDERFTVLRSNQRSVCDTTDNCWIIPNYDLGDIQIIHPTTKDVLADRMLKIYSATKLGENVKWESPEVDTVTIDGKKVILKIKNTYGGLKAKKKAQIQGFEVADESGKWHTAIGKIVSENTIEVSSETTNNPKYIRYYITGYINSDSPKNSAGMPLIPFSTSDEPLTFTAYRINR